MRISTVSIKNYRNLDGTKVSLNENVNFLVGENDLGKSNFLDMLNLIFNARRFSEEDFTQKNLPIEVECSILLNPKEQGMFEDFFDPTNISRVNIVARQLKPDEDIRYYHVESGEEMPYTRFRCVNFIKYDSLRMPREELSFYRGKGVGKFLIFLMNKFIEQQSTPIDESCIDRKALQPALDYINNRLRKLKIFRDFRINATFENELIDLIYRILTIKDSRGFDIQKIGHGIQFSVLILLSILERIMRVIEDTRREQCISEDEDGKSISLIIGLDEPEIHLHPYMQRSLMKYIKRLLSNRDDDFASLLKDLFDIDSVDGQAIVVCHSPSVLLDNYKNIVRFYKRGDKIEIRSGDNINLDGKTEKHLMKNLPYIKEAFFSRCNILVEGDSEYGAFPVFATRLNYDLDEFGISIIQAGSADSIPSLARLLNEFRISNISIMDKDKFLTYNTVSETVELQTFKVSKGEENIYIVEKHPDGYKAKIKAKKMEDFSDQLKKDLHEKELRIFKKLFRTLRHLMCTFENDFESEVFQAFALEDYIRFLEEHYPENKYFFMNDARPLGIELNFEKKSIYEQMKVLASREKEQLKMELKEDIVKFLKGKKSIMTGRILAEYVSKVPDVYRSVIEKAVSLAKNE